MAEKATSLPVQASEKPATRTPAPARHPLATLQRQMDRLFDDFRTDFFQSGQLFPRSNFEPFSQLEAWAPSTPAVDIIENDAAYEITAELPGINEKDVEVTTVNGILAIKAEKQESKEEKGKEYHLSERRYGSVQRAFRIPPGVDLKTSTANFANGVLTVTLPKTAAAQKPERIAVKTG